MRRILPALVLILLATPVLAAEPVAEGGAPGTNVDMPFLMAPMNGADGKLASYAYISSRLTTNSDASTAAVRDRIAFIQDAFVRDVNGAPIVKTDDVTAIDMPGLQARLLADVRKVMGSGKVVALVVVQVQVAPLHPQQTPAMGPPAETTPPSAPQPAPVPAAPAKAS